MSRRLLLAGAVVVLAGCATAPPDMPPPTLELTEADRFSTAADAPQPGPAAARWWLRFDDPALADWVGRALAGSPDIAIARERIVQAQALLQGARAQRGVSLGARVEAATVSRRDRGERAFQPAAALTLDWDTDLWGGLHQAERSAAAGVLRSQHVAQATRLASAGLAARGVIEWREAQHDAALLADALALQRDVLRVAQVRFDVGLAPRLDLDRATADLAALEADAAAAAVRTRQALAALRVLAGERPMPVGAPAESSTGSGGVPALQGALPAARPLDLLRGRPDLQAAEQALLAAAADIGVAQAALRPGLRLPGTLALASGAGVLDIVSASLAAVLDATLFDGGRRQAEVTAAGSRAREAAQVYRLTLLQALQQAEAAYVASAGSERRIGALQRARDAADAAVVQARLLYSAGLTGQLDVLDARRTALAQQRALLRAQADAARQAVAGFEALGLVDEPAAPA